MTIQSLGNLLTPELIAQIQEGNIDINKIQVKIPSQRRKESPEEIILYKWLEEISEGKTTESFDPEFWFMVETLCKIKRLGDSVDITEEDINDALNNMEAKYTTYETIQALANNHKENVRFLRACMNSSFLVKPRGKKVPETTTDTPI